MHNPMLSYPTGKGPKEHLNGDSIKRRRGRPVGSGLSQDKTVAAIRVTETVKMMLDEWKERFNADTYDEAIRSFSQESITARKKVDALTRGQMSEQVAQPRRDNLAMDLLIDKQPIDWREGLK
jgi:hypothetical protein